MATNVQGQTARIYKFPAPKNSALSNKPRDAQTSVPEAPRALKIASGQAWYHEEALLDTEPSKN
jgi:Protein of unknown function (DUF2735)